MLKYIIIILAIKLLRSYGRIRIGDLAFNLVVSDTE